MMMTCNKENQHEIYLGACFRGRIAGFLGYPLLDFQGKPFGRVNPFVSLSCHGDLGRSEERRVGKEC